MSIGISIYMFSPVLVRWRRQPTWQIKAHITQHTVLLCPNDYDTSLLTTTRIPIMGSIINKRACYRTSLKQV